MSAVERMAPHNLEAEEAVLGSLLIDPEAVFRVATFLNAEDFYREKNGWIYQAILDLHDRREPVDFVTLCDELERRGQLAEVGGAAYIADLIASVPTSIHVEHYGHIVERTATLRRLIAAAGQIAGLAYEEAEDLDEIVDRAEQLIFGVSQRRIVRDLTPIKQVIHEYYDRIDYLYQHRGEPLGIPTGYKLLDKLLGGLQRSDLIIIAGRPGMGKTSLLLSIAQNAARKFNQRVALFSLEMSAEQVVQRLISAETGIDSQRLRLGELREDEWPTFVQATGVLSDTQIFIDDTPAISALQMRTKARRLHAEHGLDLIMVDYLQLMRGDFRAENRVQEVSYISRELKSLARELNVPVIAASQLSRAVEQRQDKRPQLSDLRESGCLTGDTRIQRADTGELVPLADLARAKEPVPVWALGPDWKLHLVTMSKVFPSGVKPVYRLRTRSGRSIRASANHPFRRLEGWVRLDALTVGDRIAVPRLAHPPARCLDMDPDRVVLLAHLIGNGRFVERQPLHYTSRDPACLDAVEKAARQFDVTPRRVKQKNWWHIYLSANHHLTHGTRNPIAAWLDELGIYGQRSKEKSIPPVVFRLPNEQVALFLRHLWATDGTIGWNPKTGHSGRADIRYHTSSLLLAEQVRHLLLRLGINARIRVVPQRNPYDPQYHVDVSGKADQERFLDTVGVFGAKEKRAALIRAELSTREANPNCGVIPKEIWRTEINRARQAAGLSWRDFSQRLGMSYCGSTLFKHSVSRKRLERITHFLPDQVLCDLAHSDVYWDEIVDIELEGEETVYDGTVPGLHNFIANDIFVHNSIEQDADVVMFIYRDAIYNPDTEFKNIADIIIAKHRHGPTGHVPLFFKAELAQFLPVEQIREDLEF